MLDCCSLLVVVTTVLSNPQDRSTTKMPMPQTSPCANADESGLPLPGKFLPARLPEFQAQLKSFLSSGKYRTLNWCEDKKLRDTGPFVNGVSYGVHPTVKIYYSPAVINWLLRRDSGQAIPDGAMIIKEQYSPPAAKYQLQPPKGINGWTITIKDSKGSQDGWYWAEIWDAQCVDNNNPPFAYPYAGFGLYCVRCHASAEKEHTFTYSKNIKGFPGDPDSYFVDLSWASTPVSGHASPPAQPCNAAAESDRDVPTAGHNTDSSDVQEQQTAQVQPDDFIIVVDTLAYEKAFKSGVTALTNDIPLIKARLTKGKRQLISLALTGRAGPHEFEDCTLGSFYDETHYPVSLFNLVLNLYAIPLTHAGFAPLRQTLHRQWEQTLAQTKVDDDTAPLKIFISYSHKDETFKAELVTMLAGLQNRGIVDTWQDRLIEPGDEWNKFIQNAMNNCDLALLLVSPDYIASRFIQHEEQPKLLQRRQEMQLRVIPIIVRPCTWKSEPVIKELQVLPKDGKAIITFSESTGERDQVWTDIAIAIEERAKMRS
jgi:TIR domain/Cytochrome P460